jgi:hypothetical protein
MKRVSALVVVMVLSLGAVLLLPASGLPAGEKMDMEKMISSAKTGADHEALAAEYETEATAAKAQAAEHRKMARATGSSEAQRSRSCISTSIASDLRSRMTRQQWNTRRWRRLSVKWRKRRSRAGFHGDYPSAPDRTPFHIGVWSARR